MADDGDNAVWIDEEGRIVRHDAGTYTKMMKFANNEFGSDDYVPGLRDWLKKGAESAYAMKPEAVSGKLGRRTSDAALAEPTSRPAAPPRP